MVGYANNGNTFYYTDGEGATLADLGQQDNGTLKAGYNGITAGVKTIAGGNGTDWKTLTTTSTGSDLFDALVNYNLNGVQGTHLTLETGAAFSSDATDNSFFTLGTDGILQYGAAAVPGTQHLRYVLAGAGLLVLSLRKQFRSKQALIGSSHETNRHP